MLGETEVACLEATVVASGSSTGISEIAVSTLSVLAGRNQPCGSLAASTWPVPASATIHAEALIAGSFGPGPGAWLTITPRPASCAPPMTAGFTGGGATAPGDTAALDTGAAAAGATAVRAATTAPAAA